MAEQIIEEAVVRVQPSFVGFRSALQTGLKKNTAGVNAVVGVKVDKKSLAVAAVSIKSALKDVKLNVGADLKSARTDLKTFHQKWNGRVISLKVEVDTREAEARLKRLDRRIRRTGRGGAGGEPGGILGGNEGGNLPPRRRRRQSPDLGRLITAPERLLANPAVLTGLAPVLVAATGAAGGLASALSVATAGVGVFAGAAIGHVKQLQDVLEQTKGVGVGMFAPVVAELNQLKTTYADFLTATRGPVLQVFTSGLQVANSLLPKFAPLVNISAASLEGLTTQFGRFTESAEFTSFLSFLEDRAPSAIQSFGVVTENLIRSVMNLIQAFDPLGQITMGGLEGATRNLAQWTNQLSQSQGFQEFSDYVVTTGPIVVDTIVSIAGALTDIVIAAAPVGAALLTLIRVLSEFISWLNPDILTTFAFGLAAVKIGAIAVGLAGSAGAKGVAALATSIWGASAATNAFKLALVRTGIGAIIVGIGYALSALIPAFEGASDASLEFAAAQQSITDALRESNGLIDENVRKTAVKALSDQGMLAHAKDLGITPEELATAYLGSESDWAAVVQRAKDRAEEIRAQYFVDTSGAGLTPDVSPEDEAALKFLDDFVEKNKDMGGVVGQARLKLQLETQAMGSFAAGTDAATDSVIAATTAWERYQKALEMPGTVKVIQDVIGLYDAWKDAGEAVGDAQQNLRNVTEQNAISAEQSARRVSDAQQGVVDAQDRVRQAYEGVTKAQQDLTRAREEAIRKLRDQPDTEESLKIALATAEQTKILTSGLSSQNLARRRAVLDVKNAREDLQDFRADKITNVEQDPGVINARENLRNAKKDVKTAESELRKAHLAVRDAYAEQTRTIEAGKRARRDALDSVEKANTKLDEQETMLYRAATAAGIYIGDISTLKTKLDNLEDTYQMNMKLNKGNVDKDLQTTAQYLEAIRMSALDSSLTWQQAWSKAGAAIKTATTPPLPSQSARDAARRKNELPSGLAVGGAVIGAGTRTSDSIPASGPAGQRYRLSNGEHIWTAAEVQAAGGHGAVKRMRNAVIGRATGGPINGPTIKLDPKIGTTPLAAAKAEAAAYRAGLYNTRGETGPPATGAVFGKFPPSAESVHGRDSGIWRQILAMARAKGFSGGYGGYNNRRTSSGSWSWHASGRAIDLMGYNMDALASYFASQRPLELIHRTRSRDYAYTRGVNKGSFNNGLMEAHRNHVHVAFRSGGAVVADNGAVLPPRSRTLVENRTNNPELVGFPGMGGMSDADMRRLAVYMAQALSTRPGVIKLGERQMGEVIRENVADALYLP